MYAEEDGGEIYDDPVDDPVDYGTQSEVATYEKRWRQKLRRHAKSVPGPDKDHAFSLSNLVPRPNPSLWQYAPHVPFGELKSDEAENRLSVCRPISGLQEAACVGGVPTYAQNTGDVNIRRRAPLQLASTMGFILNKNGANFMKEITPAEKRATHECIHWLRKHNPVLQLYGTAHERMVGAFKTFREALKHIIPEGHPRARIRLDKRESRAPREAELGSTLERERTGLVVVDQAGHPMNYNGISALSEAMAKQDVIVRVDVPGEGGKGWARAPGEIAVEEKPDLLTQRWKEDLVTGAQVVMEESWVAASDPDYDAKVFPKVHPHGTPACKHVEAL